MKRQDCGGLVPPAASLLVMAAVMIASCDVKPYSPRDLSGEKEIFSKDSTYVFRMVLDTVYYDSAAIEEDRWQKWAAHRPF